MTEKSKTTAHEHSEHGDDKSITSVHMRKRDKFRNLFRSEKPEVHANPLAAQPEAEIHHTDFVSIKAGDDNSSTHSSKAVSGSEASSRPTSKNAKVRLEFFSANVPRPAIKAALPKFGARIDSTPQLVLCSSLIPKSPALSPSNESSPEIHSLQIKETSQDALVD
ncbi:hypothetical protein BGZ72_002491, partial [Mortierella alpina]